MKISFHGADKNVTGSCHLIQCDNKKILIDCGMYQGGHEAREENTLDFGFDPATIDYLLLTHAHLDHCGRIPLLVKRGFKGEIITTSASRELAKLVMLDAAGLQEAEAERSNRRHYRLDQQPVEPLYTILDALNSLDYFGRTAAYEQPFQLTENININFYDAGHILGSASILFTVTEAENTRRVLFSGDLGYSNRAILRNPQTPGKVDVVIMETTYGDRKHKALQPSIDEMFEAINTTFKHGGNVVIPSFALERAQEILFYLRQGLLKNQLPAYMPVFLDSPMAISATEIFRRHSECYDKKTSEIFNHHKDPFGFDNLHFVRETADSIALNRIKGGAVLMAGSGMCTGGRVVHHLKYNLWRKDSAVVFVGYAAMGTLARRILDGAKHVTLFREQIPVRAQIYTIGGFSAHADCEELYDWHRKTGPAKKTFLVHGEEKSMNALARKLTGTEIIKPDLHSEYEL